MAAIQDLLQAIHAVHTNNHINTDRAYILLHNMRYFLTEKQKLGSELTPNQETLLLSCLTSISNYRKATKEAHLAATQESMIQDGDLRNFWALLETDAKYEALRLENSSLRLWQEIEKLMKDESIQTLPANVGVVCVDLVNDFFTNDFDGEKATLPVCSTEKVATATARLVFSAHNAKNIIYTMEGHNPEKLGGSAWSKPDEKTKKLEPLPAEICKHHPKAGGVCWGPHCGRDMFGADFIPELPLHPEAFYIIKGTRPYNHPYGAGDLMGHNLAVLLKNVGIDTILTPGVASTHCVKDTAQQAMAGGINVILPLNCTAGIFIPESMQKIFGSEYDKTKDYNADAQAIDKIVFDVKNIRYFAEHGNSRFISGTDAEYRNRLRVIENTDVYAISQAVNSFTNKRLRITCN